MQAEWKRPIYVGEANAHPSLTGGNVHMPKGSCESGVCSVHSMLFLSAPVRVSGCGPKGPAFLLTGGKVHMPKGSCE